MKQVIPIAAALVLLGAGTYYQGDWTERWWRNTSDTLDQFDARLENVPARFGEWVGEERQVDEKAFAASHCTGCVSREYKNRRTGDVVSMYLVSGTARHVTIHTPDWCYQAAGYDMDSDPVGYTVKTEGKIPDPEFRTATFTKTEASGTERLRIFWTYSDNGHWLGPVWPKPHYARRPALYKVYLITSVSGESDKAAADSPSVEFAKEFFPVVNEVLFPTAPADTAVAAS